MKLKIHPPDPKEHNDLSIRVLQDLALIQDLPTLRPDIHRNIRSTNILVTIHHDSDQITPLPPIIRFFFYILHGRRTDSDPITIPLTLAPFTGDIQSTWDGHI